MEIKVDFVDNLDDNAQTLAAPNAGSLEPSQGLRIQVKYEIQRSEQLIPVKLYCRPSARKSEHHRRLCQMNSIADLVTGKSYRSPRQK